jgi:rhodanese-related sulfurtransferase
MRLLRLWLAWVVILSLAGNALAKDAFEEEVDKEALAVKVAEETVKGGYGLVTAPGLKSLMDQGKPMLVVDTMPFADSYKKEHLPGAVNFVFPVEPMEEWDPAKTGGKSLADFEKFLGPDKNRLLVFYCGFVKCGRSHNGAAWAKKLGYANVLRMPGGIFAWKGLGYGLEAAKE